MSDERSSLPPLADGYETGPLPTRPKVLFMGTPDFAVPSLRALVESGAEVVGVVSQPDRPKGRGKRLTRTPVASVADELGLEVYQWARLSQESFDALSALQPDLAVVIAYGKILPRRYLALPRWGCVNLHGSLLPAYRGAAPIQWSVIHGEQETGVSVMRLDEGMDTGPVALTRSTPIGPQETTGQLYERLAQLAAEALTEALTLWRRPEGLQFIEQDHASASHAPMLSKEDGLIDWTRDARDLSNLTRGVSPWPGAHVPCSEGSLKIHEVTPLDEAELEAFGPEALRTSPGVVISAEGEGPVVRCGRGALRLLTLQRPNRSRVSGTDFIRGYATLKVGASLT